MSLDHNNNKEWANPENWSGPRWMGIYFSKRDTRLWVPKKIPALGWTINFGHPKAVYWLLGFLIGVPLAIVAAHFGSINC